MNKVVLIFFFTSYSILAQNQAKIDSLLDVLINKTDNNTIDQVDSKIWDSSDSTNLYHEIKHSKIKLNYDLALRHKKKGEYTEAIAHFTEVLKLKDSLGDTNVIAFCYNNIGQMHVRLGNYTKAINYNLKALQLSKELDDKNELFSGYNNLGMINVYQGDYSNALDHFIKASKINNEIRSKKYTIISLSNIGFIYETFGNYSLALKYYFKSLEISKQIKDESNISQDYLNIANIYFEQGNSTKALSYSYKSLKIAKELDSKSIMISNSCLIGEIYLKQKKYNKALKHLKIGLSLSQEIGEQSSLTTILNTIGGIHLELKNYLQAKKHLIQSINIGQTIGNPSPVNSASYSLSQIEKALGNHKEALKYYELYHVTYDSLLGKEKSKQLSQLQIQYETEKKEQEIKSLAQQASIQTLELKQVNFNKTIFAVSSVVLLLLGLVLYLVNRQKQLTLKQRAQDIEQNLLRVQMNPHFIFNAMTSIQEYMNQGNSKKAGLYLVKFSKLIRQVLDNSRSEFVSLDQEINMLDNYLSIQNLKREYPFNFNIEVEDSLITDEIAIPPMFAQPFVENAIEHGIFSIKDGAIITIHFAIKEEYLILKIKDNGSGIKEALKIKQKNHVSHALKITEERIELYRRMQKKNIAFDVQNLSQGTLVTFSLPFQYI